MACVHLSHEVHLRSESSSNLLIFSLNRRHSFFSIDEIISFSMVRGYDEKKCIVFLPLLNSQCPWNIIWENSTNYCGFVLRAVPFDQSNVQIHHTYLSDLCETLRVGKGDDNRAS